MFYNFLRKFFFAENITLTYLYETMFHLMNLGMIFIEL